MRKLYLRIENKYANDVDDVYKDRWKYFNFDQHTYIFDLTGSSKALQF